MVGSPRATSAGRIIVREQNEALDPLGNGDERQAIGPKRGPNRHAQSKMRGPCGLPSLSKAQHGSRRSETESTAEGATPKPFRRIEISDWQARERIEKQPQEGESGRANV